MISIDHPTSEPSHLLVHEITVFGGTFVSEDIVQFRLKKHDSVGNKVLPPG
jgi:hypothetical protein